MTRVELLFWASRLSHWWQALLIVEPETLLRWHREGFRLFWRWKTRAGKVRPRLPQPCAGYLTLSIADGTIAKGR